MATISLPSLTLLTFLCSCLLCRHFDFAYGDDGVDGCSPNDTFVGHYSDQCRSDDDNACCEEGTEYKKYYCSPPVTSSTQARMTLNSFQEDGDGGAPAECDDNHHDNTEMIVALSTGWYDGGSRCGKNIKITSSYNGETVSAMVVDECDSARGCDEKHAFQKPCDINVVDASRAVWNALGFSTDDEIWKYDQITWSDE